MPESRRCRGDVKGVERGAQDVVYGLWKMAAVKLHNPTYKLHT